MGKIALITGASSGIGRELAKELAAKSYDLILIARKKDALEELAEELRTKNNVRVWTVDHDLSDPSRINELIERVKGLGVEINVLINNAGAGIYGPLNELNNEDIIRIISLNYITPILLTKGFIQDLIKNRGCVVNIISLAAFTPIPWFEIYTSSKAALANLTDSLRIELKTLGIRVIGVYPGYVKTNFHNNTIVTKTTAKAREEPKGPLLNPNYVAKAIVKKIEDPNFNGNITPSTLYSIAHPLMRTLYPLVRYYIDKWFTSKSKGFSG